jgi:hypothetical protein
MFDNISDAEDVPKTEQQIAALHRSLEPLLARHPQVFPPAEFTYEKFKVRHTCQLPVDCSLVL